jgi:hypothetical protein
MRRLRRSRNRCLAGTEVMAFNVFRWWFLANEFSSCADLSRCGRDQADAALSSATVLRPSGSSLMSLRRVPRRPDPVSGVGVARLSNSQGIRTKDSHQSRLGLPLRPSNQVHRRGGAGAWRSVDLGFCQIKEERSGGHSRRYVPVPPRLAHQRPATSVLNL